MTGYYDYVLGLIPVSLIGITALLSVIGLPLTAAVPVGAAAAIGIIAHAVFVNVPVDPQTTESAARSPSQNRINAD